MTLFEKHIGRPITLKDRIHEREFYVSLIFSKSEVQDRWRKIGYERPKPEQLKLNL